VLLVDELVQAPTPARHARALRVALRFLEVELIVARGLSASGAGGY
jgi:hypothetical protein